MSAEKERFPRKTFFARQKNTSKGIKKMYKQKIRQNPAKFPQFQHNISQAKTM